MMAPMWLHDLKRKNAGSPLSSTTPASTTEPLHKQRHGLSRQELDRLIRKTQELRDELTAAVRHVDPSEYSDERIQQLLAEARKHRRR